MEKMDNGTMVGDAQMDDEELLMQHVVQNDHELLFLHSYLEELLRGKSA